MLHWTGSKRNYYLSFILEKTFTSGNNNIKPIAKPIQKQQVVAMKKESNSDDYSDGDESQKPTVGPVQQKVTKPVQKKIRK